MKSKNWLIGFFAILVIGIGSYMAVNYYVDPLGFFSVEHGLDQMDAENCTRSAKAKYILNHKDEIDAVVIGGSKGGILDPELLYEYTGLRYYNMYSNVGTFKDYLANTRFLIEKTDIQEITLHLSSFESRYYDKTNEGTNMQIPKLEEGSPWEIFTETLSFLMTDTQTLKQGLNALKEDQSNTTMSSMSDGIRVWRRYIRNFNEGGESLENYLNVFIRNNFNKEMNKLVNGTNAVDSESYALNLEALKEIKQLCDDNSITLKVVIGSSFIAEHALYESDYYYDYLYQIVNIVGSVWDFSDFSEVNYNPYNFINIKHHSYAVADLELATMYGADSHEGFGILLTTDNILDYLAKRKADCAALIEEYVTTGTVAMPGMDDDSYIPWPNASDYLSYLE